MLDLKIFTDNIDQDSLDQIETLLSQETFKDSKIRIMPDVHVGVGCVIGFTAELKDKIIPNLVGVDLNCGILTIELGKVELDLERLDKIIKDHIPSGFSVQNKIIRDFPELESLHIYNELTNKERLKRSICSLGGGNHFIEIGEDDEGIKYLIIHTGSRNLGHQVATYYQDLAVKSSSTNEYLDYKFNSEKTKVIAELKAQNKQEEIPQSLKKLQIDFIKQYSHIPKNLAYLEGEEMQKYLDDVEVCKQFASLNRAMIARIILEKLNIQEKNSFETIHNYIGADKIIRKGAISAHLGQQVIIPINMRDGCIIAKGKGNPDWNYSAPHGAGRVMSRREARRTLSLREFQAQMKNVYTTTAVKETLDEAPSAYKPIQEIIDNIKDTVEIIKIVKPIYNYKATK